METIAQIFVWWLSYWKSPVMISNKYAAALLLASTALAHIDRENIVSKYKVVRTSLIDNETTPLQVGNGDFAFSVDNTGMQTFLPFNTLSTWAWHNDSLPTNGEELSDYVGVAMDTHGRDVYYDIPDPELPAISQWIIGNPNRVNLGRIGLKYNGDTLQAEDISNPKQVLDPWSGIITSTFTVAGKDVRVVTQGDFESDAVAFDIDSPLIKSGDLEVELDFPYPPIHTVEYKYEVFVGSYDFPANHTTTMKPQCSTKNSAHIYREMQETKYFVNLAWPAHSPLELSRDEPAGSTSKKAHRFTLAPSKTPKDHASSSISLSAHFSPEKHIPDLPEKIQRRNPKAWQEYWEEGGFVDLTDSSNAAAEELQRRIILSQYHVRVNSAATGQIPQESGLMNNGWYGKFHMEMAIWHEMHWATWGKQKYFDKIFPAVYESLLDSSLARAKKMGWEGARWPKMTELVSGVSSPGLINALLMWQQPHPMLLASYAYQASPTRRTLKKWDKILSATADYMASYAWKNESSGYYDLGPPSFGVTENTPPEETLNLAFEISYWRYGLDVARNWKKALKQPVPEKWTTVAENLAPPPQIDGLYAVYEGLNSTWWEDPELNGDPRSLIMMLGFMPDSANVDPDIELRTADKIAEVWTDDNIRGWGRPILALNSARIGRPERAIYHLTAYEYWTFDDAGFAVRGGDGGTPPPFMPGNAGFLWAVSNMAEGWSGSKGDAPGFPKNDGWVVKHEGLVKSL